jgi:glycosyltransferase involved in cell wall biosynthesis
VKRNKVVLIAPTSNEIDAVKVVFPKIDKKIVDDIIVVDLNSTDGTVEYCRKLGIRVHKQKTKGYGAAMQEGLEINHNEIIIEFPPDGSSPPERIKDFVDKINEGYDLVIGSRYMKGAKSYDDDIITAFGNFMFTRIVNLLFRTHFTDVLIGYRAYRRSTLDKLDIKARKLDWSVELPIRFAKAGAKIIDIPVDEPKRIGGKRKMHPIKTGLDISRVILWEFFHPKSYIKSKRAKKK